MFRTIVLIICAIFLFAQIGMVITEENIGKRLTAFISAVLQMLMFYYIWVT